MQELKSLTDKLIENISKAIIGKEETIKMVVLSLISNGHILLEDVPGVGKTLLSKSLAKSIKSSFKRIQFTADLLPSDIIGVSIYSQKKEVFEYIEGPIFSNIVLADEINRATPRTQSSLLEAMEEKQVSVDGETHLLPELFFVIGTQNPLESHGTFPLPDSQMDRFLLSISIGYPSNENESKMLERHNNKHNLLENVNEIIDMSKVIEIKEYIYKNIEVTKEIFDYIIRITSETRNNQEILQGVSPRCSLALLQASKGYAFMSGRNYVIPDDVKLIAPYVMAHRVITYKSLNRKKTWDLLINLINSIPTTVI